MKILIVNPPFYRLQRASLMHYPQGCCFVGGALERAGFNSVKIYNTDFEARKKTILGNTNHLNGKALKDLAKEYDRRLHDDNDPIWKEINDYISKEDPNVLVFGVFSTTITAGIKIAKMAKAIKPSIVTVFEGNYNRGLHCAIDPSKQGDWGVMDFAIRKEPEETVVELMQALEKGQKDFYQIKGLSWRNGKGTIHNEDRPAIANLDTLPRPGRHLIAGYKDIPAHAWQGIQGSRGCPFDCTFCGTHTGWGYKPRLRSAENMVEEMEYVHKNYGTHYFYMCDDIFFYKKERVVQFCDLLIQKKLPIYWSAQTRAELVDDEMLSKMKRAGGQHVAVGVECGNPRIREMMKKGNTIEDVRRCAKLIKKHGLRMVAFTMVGLPQEGPQEIQDTINLIKEIDPHIVYAYMATPAAGTELADQVAETNPDGLVEFRDRCHIDVDASLANLDDKKREVIGEAMATFEKMNKRNLVWDLFKRPRFYLALAQDMGFLKKPKALFSYVKDALN